MLSRRLFSAAILISLSLGLIWLDLNHQVRGQTGLWTLPMLLLFTLGTVWEFSSLLARKWWVNPTAVTLHALASLGVCLFPIWYSLALQTPYPANCPVGRLGWILIGIMTGVGLCGLQALRGVGKLPRDSSLSESEQESAIQQHRERTTLGWLLSSMVLCYVVSGTMMWQVIRMRGESSGLYELIALLAIIKFADAGAYFVGKLCGRTKLIPSVSPAKTVEGFVGGCLFAVGIAYLAFRGILPEMGIPPGPHWWGPALMGVLLATVGLVGDLLESMVKRSVGAKDSGRALPGLGGVWDVTDSVLPASFISYLGLIAQL